MKSMNGRYALEKMCFNRSHDVITAENDRKAAELRSSASSSSPELLGRPSDFAASAADGQQTTYLVYWPAPGVSLENKTGEFIY